jgi:predicted nucleic acid-binding protein
VRFLDTNVIIRFLVRDDEDKAKACLSLFQQVKRGDVRLTTSGAVVCEAVYVLSSPRTYGLCHGDIRARLVPIISLPGLHLEGKRTYLRALDLYSQWAWADFEDALTVAFMERLGIDELLSYDRGFDSVASIERSEP